MTLEVQQRREMGRYEEGSLGGLLGLRMGMMWAFFHKCGIELVSQERLKILVRADMPLDPRCLRWMLDMSSGPVALEFFSRRMVLLVMSFEKGGGLSEEILMLMFRLDDFRLSL